MMDFKDIPMLTQSGSYEINTGIGYLQDTIDRYIEEYGLQLCPDFQRGHVWTEAQQVAYVEFFLKGGMTGRTIFMNHPQWSSLRQSKKGEYGEMVLVDGLQRLTALLKFVNGELPAFGHYIMPKSPDKVVKGRSYFDGRLHSARAEANLRININNLPTKAAVLKWYLEMNSGGTPHTEAELDKVRDLLVKEKP